MAPFVPSGLRDVISAAAEFIAIGLQGCGMIYSGAGKKVDTQ
jgi:hypothetical protein